jgi:hypothetical protein
MGWMRASDRRTVFPTVAAWAMLPTNSKNCVACTIEYGRPESLMSSSCAIFARKYPLSASRPVPTTDNATWCPTPASSPAARRLAVEVRKKSSTASSANEGEFETSTRTSAPSSTSANPSPVSVSTPESGDAGTASWPCSASFRTSFEPISPLPPITTIFMGCLPSRAPAAPGRRTPARTGQAPGL